MADYREKGAAHRPEAQRTRRELFYLALDYHRWFEDPTRILGEEAFKRQALAVEGERAKEFGLTESAWRSITTEALFAPNKSSFDPASARVARRLRQQ